MTQKIDRQGFFKNYLCDLLEGLDTAFGEEFDRFADKFPDLIRPPGACLESAFLQLCSRCGNCVRACPFFVLKPVMMTNDFDKGTPALRCQEAFCRFCERFPCVAACRTGALALSNVDRLRKIGSATCKDANCLRSQGTDCRVCLEKCKELGYEAITISDGNPPVVDSKKCSGCGACAVVCPAYPDSAIVIKPV
jgi:ferredoxin-type protein NapG